MPTNPENFQKWMMKTQREHVTVLMMREAPGVGLYGVSVTAPPLPEGLHVPIQGIH